jgi:predicted NUDIX family NTP pyrophosphohydrolase
MPRTSAGILLYRRGPHGIEVLLAHPGGPAWTKRDHGAWSLPKGEIESTEEPLEVARREFLEETGHEVPAGRVIPLGAVRQASGKMVLGFGVEGDLDPAVASSNTFSLEWPPRSGAWHEVPEVDRVAWFLPDDARRRLNAAQAAFVDRLLEELAD